MTDVAAIDFETANGRRSSVCSVGIVIVRNGDIVDIYQLYQYLIHNRINFAVVACKYVM